MYDNSSRFLPLSILTHFTNRCRRRLQREAVALNKNPVDYIRCSPLEGNILQWHYVISGPPGSHYSGGTYHGLLKFPPEYPLKPPSVMMYTPSGRFKPNRRLCLSMSDFHPESWNPMWSVATILTGLFSFMLDTAATQGSIESGVSEKKQLATASMAFNERDQNFCKLFPDLLEEYREKVAKNAKNGGAQLGASSSSSSSTSNGGIANNDNGDLVNWILGFMNNFSEETILLLVISFFGIVYACSGVIF